MGHARTGDLARETGGPPEAQCQRPEEARLLPVPKREGACQGSVAGPPVSTSAGGGIQGEGEPMEPLKVLSC